MKKTIKVHINRNNYDFEDEVQTGQSLKERAGIPLTDVLFYKQPKEDAIVLNDAKVILKEGDHFYSQPAADYGDEGDEKWPAGSRRIVQPDGWHFLVLDEFDLPEPYVPRKVKLLIKLPPLFPDAQPDQMWLQPAVVLPGGVVPRGSASEPLLGETWQRYSWHLKPGAWQPGISDIWDYMRCVRARFERRD